MHQQGNMGNSPRGRIYRWVRGGARDHAPQNTLLTPEVAFSAQNAPENV